MSQKINLTKRIVAVSLLLFSAIAFVSCKKYTYDPPKIDLTTPVSFKNEIAPIFISKCYSCHKSSTGLNFADAAKTWTSINKTKYITPEDPESSFIYIKLTSGTHETKCTAEERNKIYAWIKQGAINDNE